MTDFDPGMPQPSPKRADRYRNGKKSNIPVRNDVPVSRYSPYSATGDGRAAVTDTAMPSAGMPSGVYSSAYAAGQYEVRNAPYAGAEQPSAAPASHVYGESDLPTVEQTMQAAVGGERYYNRDTGNRRGMSAKRGAFSPLQNAVLLLAVCVLGVAMICFTVSLVRRGTANAAMRQVQETRQRDADAYAEVVSNHLIRRAASGYEPLIRKYAAMYGINPDLVSAVIKRESDYQPQATSSAGARGLMQIMPANVEWFSHKAGLDTCTVDDLYDPEINIRLGCWYLHYLGELFDYDPVLMVCAYHAGQGNVASWLKNYSSDGKTLTIDEIPMKDTKTYAQRVVNSYAIYAQHAE